MEGKKPYVAILLLQSIYAGIGLLSKVAFNGGMNTFVFVFYRQALASVLLIPFALILERKTAPPLSLRLMIKIFLLAFVGITLCFNLYNMALKYTSATVAAAAANAIPVVTFFLAVLFRNETLNLRNISGIAKVLGVVLFLAGICVLAFYRGPHLKSLNHHHPIFHERNTNHANFASKKEWIMGTFLIFMSTITWSLWIILQGFILKEYPSKLAFTTLSCCFSTIQSFLVGMAFERDFSKWKLHFDQGLLAVAYTGIFAACLGIYLQAWCIEKKGPVFVAMSTPLALVITIACSSLLLGETIEFGSVLGGILMVGGLYSVLWGKSKESLSKVPDVERAIQLDMHPTAETTPAHTPELATPVRPLRHG